MRALASAFTITVTLVATASCATAAKVPATAGGDPAAATTTARAAAQDGTCSGFALSLAMDHGGQPSPVAAAEWFAAHGDGADVPGTGWHQAGHDESGALVRSERWTLHVIQGADRTWFVDSGRWC